MMVNPHSRKCQTVKKPIQMLECKDGNWRALDYPKEGSNDWGLHNQGGSW